MPSFDIVSKLDMQEVDNAVNMVKRDINNRYDFKVASARVRYFVDKAKMYFKTANISNGIAKPKSKIQIMQKIKKIMVKNKKFSFLYFKIISLFDLINS